MNIVEATLDYERWLKRHTPLIPRQVRLKHEHMRESPFSFLRATFYRWAQFWPEICSDLAAAPKVLGVGDLHAENFGTWRDLEGRLVWGINDFDESDSIAYTNDLVRLLASVLFAREEQILAASPTASAEAILEGYCEGWRERGKPFLLGEKNKRLLLMAQGGMRAPALFWDKIDAVKKVKQVPPAVRRAICPRLPEPRLELTFAPRVCGLGSLGRQRFVGLAEWHGARVAREAKAMAPSALVWARRANSGDLFYQRILDRSVRCPDPFVRIEGRWVVRRLTPDCSRIELKDLPVKRDELRLLYCMGWEAANIHLGTPKARAAILVDLKKRRSGWLLQAARDMARAVSSDWKAWLRA